MGKKSIEISVGSVYIFNSDNRNQLDTRIITDTGAVNSFFASRCQIVNGALEILDIGGTETSKYIRNIIGCFPSEQVEKALLEFWGRKLKVPLTENLREEIAKAVNSKPRRINLD